jgi:hypothetical protein
LEVSSFKHSFLVIAKSCKLTVTEFLGGVVQ